MQLSSELIYKLIDQFSAPAQAMAAAQEKATASLAKIDKFKTASKTLDQAALAYKRAQGEAKRMAAQLAAVENPTNKMQRAVKRAEAEVVRLGAAFKKQGADVRTMRSALAAADLPINKLAASERRLRADIEKTNQAMARQKTLATQQAQAAARAQTRRQEWRNVGAVVGYAAAHRAKRFGHDILDTYRDFDRERRYGKAVMGLTDEQQEPLVRQALHGGATTRFNDIQWLEGQRDLANRGLKRDQILGVMGAGANLGTAMDLTLPESVKLMENAIFGFKKKIDTTESAIRSATRTADLQVKAAKISGMTPDDIAALYRFGANSAQMNGMSEETLLGFGGIMKKAGIGGDQSGTAYRAMMASMVSPTRKAKEAMLANGLDFKNYQKNPEKLEIDPFVSNVASSYGVKLDKKTQSGLKKIFENKELIRDPSKFTPAVMGYLRDNLDGDDAKSLKSIAGMANRFRDSSMKGVDTNKFMYDLMMKMPGNAALANAIFGGKQGGRIATALGNPEVFKHMMEELVKHADGYSKQIADERNQGLAGQTAIFEGAMKTLMTQIGKSFDNDGKGGTLTSLMSTASHVALSLAELDSRVLAVATTLGAGGAAYLGFKSIASIGKLLSGGTASAALTGSAAALDGSAAALTRAAFALGKGGGLSSGLGTAAGTAGGVGAGAAGTVAAGTGAAPAAAVGAVYTTAIAAAAAVAVKLINAGDEASGHSKDPNYRPMTMGRAFNMITGGSDLPDDPDSPLAQMSVRAAQQDAQKTPEQRAAQQEQARQNELKRQAENRSRIERIQADMAARKAQVDAGKLNPKIYANYEKGMQSQLRNLYRDTPEEQGPPIPAGATANASQKQGIPLPPSRPEGLGAYCEAVRGEMSALKDDVSKTMAEINAMLAINANPVINARVSVSGDTGGGLQSSPAATANRQLDRSRATSLRDAKPY